VQHSLRAGALAHIRIPLWFRVIDGSVAGLIVSVHCLNSAMEGHTDKTHANKSHITYV